MCIICEAQNVQTHCSVYYAQIKSYWGGRYEHGERGVHPSILDVHEG